MQKYKFRNFIIYILLLMSIISVFSTGIDISKQMPSHNSSNEQTQSFSAKEHFSNDIISNINVATSENTIANFLQNQKSNSGFSYKTSLYFLYSLLFISGLFLFTYQKRYMVYSHHFISKIGYHITYIEDLDGRKKIS